MMGPVSVKFMEVLRADARKQISPWANKDYVEVGDFTYGFPVIKSWGEGAKCRIGKFCSIAANVQIYLGGEHQTKWLTTYPFDVYFGGGVAKTKGDVVIGNDVWIGNDAKIMSGVRIGDGAVIAGSAVVTKDVEPYTIVGGVPAKEIRRRLTYRATWELIRMQWWDWPLEKIAAAVPFLASEDIKGLVAFDYEWRETYEEALPERNCTGP